ncbi:MULTISPECIES: trypsin-like peptidase domain-containing protein [Bradyrhizobium]|uniref:trypsin-like peptidase domain-containing protein n=1 Tax=Bradyrhizobium TaxID=374 RepID=UPI000425E691|nr:MULTISPECIES: trypsin-like peptidase domain-containing protein [Bradyrhizobium]UFW51105.1 serine protease [Bradyrhizobium arachidis]
MPYLSNEEIIEVSQKLVELLGYGPQIRSDLLDGIPAIVTGMFQTATQPLLSARLDIRGLNGIDRLEDGSIPLKVFLGNATSLLIGRPDAEPLRRALHKVETTATGAPVIDTTGFPELKEVVVHRDDMVPYAFMLSGVTAGKAVAKLSVKRHSGGHPQTDAAGKPMIFLGSGWLIAPNLLLTNHHVIKAREAGEAAASEQDFGLQALATTALFDYDFESVQGNPISVKELVAWDRSLDYALLRLDGDGRQGLNVGGPITFSGPDEDRPALNIIQHPDGQPKKFAIRNNLLTQATDTQLRYFTDTMAGSSGSPILDDRWNAVGLHRGATPVTGVNFNGKPVAYVNVGTQISSIISDLRERYSGKVSELNI